MREIPAPPAPRSLPAPAWTAGHHHLLPGLITPHDRALGVGVRGLFGECCECFATQIKQRQRGYDEATFVESLVILNVVGGECLEDFERLREDAGLSELTGHGVPSPEAAREFLYEFHNRADGPPGFIGFAISARRSEALYAAILKVPEEAWEAYGEPHPQEIRECAAVSFVPGERSEHKDTQPLRYVAMRIRRKQGELFDDGEKMKHFVIVTNIREWKAAKLIQWYREKAGTMEGVHDVVKNELAGGVMPCKYFGANAAWVRLAVISHKRAHSAEATGFAGRDADGSTEAAAACPLLPNGWRDYLLARR